MTFAAAILTVAAVRRGRAERGPEHAAGPVQARRGTGPGRHGGEVPVHSRAGAGGHRYDLGSAYSPVREKVEFNVGNVCHFAQVESLRRQSLPLSSLLAHPLH